MSPGASLHEPTTGCPFRNVGLCTVRFALMGCSSQSPPFSTISTCLQATAGESQEECRMDERVSELVRHI